MSKGLIGLVAYGGSDSDSSDNEDMPLVSLAGTPKQTTGTSTTGSSTAKETKEPKDSVSDRPTPQDTISVQTVIASRPSGTDSLNKIASTRLLKQGLSASAESLHKDNASEDSQLQGSESGTGFSRSQSGTPLLPDHSAAAEVMNTPTTRSPQAHPGVSILVEDQGQQGRRGALMRSLLRPRPIPGVENFGIPPSPEGEVDPAVQAKMEQFHSIKITRGIYFNQSLMKNKNFRNPHIYSSLVKLVALKETGTNFEKSEFFDFDGYGPESFATGLAEAQKQASEKLALQQQTMARSQLQFVSGSGVPSTAAVGAVGGLIARQFNTGGGPMAAVSAAGAATALPHVPSASSATIASASSGQRSRKSKWDMAQSTTQPGDSANKKSRH